MKTLMLAFAIVGIAACQPVPSVEAPTASPSCGLTANTLADERALYAAETAYNVPAHAYVTLDGAGKLSATVKANVRPRLIQAYDALKLARDAYRIGDTCNLYEAIGKVQAFAAEARAFMPSN